MPAVRITARFRRRIRNWRRSSTVSAALPHHTHVRHRPREDELAVNLMRMVELTDSDAREVAGRPLPRRHEGRRIEGPCLGDPRDGPRGSHQDRRTVSAPQGAGVIFADASALSTRVTGTVAGDYVFQFFADDGERRSEATVSVTLTVRLVVAEFGALATVTTSGSAPWENPLRVNEATTPGSSSPGAGNGWGSWASSKTAPARSRRRGSSIGGARRCGCRRPTSTGTTTTVARQRRDRRLGTLADAHAGHGGPGARPAGRARRRVRQRPRPRS